MIAAALVAHQVLDETFALEESKRLELEQLEANKKEQARRLNAEHEATKVTDARFVVSRRL